MSDSLGRRIFRAHLELSYRLGRKVTLAEFGELIGHQMKRDTPFTAAAVSRWESGMQIPTPQIIEAIATLTHTDPGWISHGGKSAAPHPPRLAVGPVKRGSGEIEVSQTAQKKASAARRRR
jgi:transcriptional regulator with XRE-family HTH domain